jgi:phage terminase large subunit-like protein
MKKWEEYIQSVISGKRTAGEFEILSVQRFLSLKENPAYYFDEAEADRVIEIFSSFKHTKGEWMGKQFNVLPWQAFFWAYIFGLKHKEDNTRVVREVLLCMAKKGGKSEVGGATGVYMTFFDGEEGAECYSAANSSDQAEFSWKAGAVMCKQLMSDDEDFASICTVHDSVNNRIIKDLDTGSFFKTIAAENRTLDGVNPHFALIDEFHEAKNDSIPKNLRSGMVQRRQPILMYVTTRGFNANGELARLERKHISLLRGQAKDDSSMSLIFALDPDDEEKLKKDWGKPVEDVDKTYWPKSNPGIGIAPTWKGVEGMWTDAVNEGVSAQTNVMVKNFNIWVRQSKAWLDMRYWLNCQGEIDYTLLKGKRAYAGMDLSTKWDLTCFGLLFPIQEGLDKVTFLCNHYCPEDGVTFRANRDRVPYPEWVKEGWLTATPGNVIDYEYIRSDIEKSFELYDIPVLYYDPKFATETAVKLTETGVNCQAMRQTQYQFNEPILKIEEWIGKGELNKGPDPILDWMFENVAIRRNQSGLMMFDKDKSREKIDGIVALGMCAAAYLDHLAPDSEKSVYLDRDFLFM